MALKLLCAYVNVLAGSETVVGVGEKEEFFCGCRSKLFAG